VKTFLKYFFAIICFGIGIAFSFSALEDLIHPREFYSDPAWIPAMLGAMFLLGAFLLLRWKPAKGSKANP
jgi:hypothetical protein